MTFCFDFPTVGPLLVEQKWVAQRPLQQRTLEDMDEKTIGLCQKLRLQTSIDDKQTAKCPLCYVKLYINMTFVNVKLALSAYLVT